MLKDYLDPEIYHLIKKTFNFDDINEIRMRTNAKLIVVIKNKKYYLKNDKGDYIVANKVMIENFIRRASENSIYAFNDSIINGYLTLPKGIRVGICGNVVSDNNNIITIKEFQSVNIRIPHIIKNCSLSAYPYLIIDNEVYNTLIISAPGRGKTTFLRDLVYQMSQNNLSKNVLIADERTEICSVIDSEPMINLGGFCDIYSNCSKKFAFKNGIRSMRPDIIVTDEIDLEKDLDCLLEAMNSGVNVIASIHAKDIKELRNKSGFENVLNQKFFNRFVVLSDTEGVGTLTNIYDEKLNCIYCR
ncbi:MAG: Flp pilus assembly complex ATPase component TadA [Clostridia bacterium]|nr:Flp pilus assembly complex ATPase component TadA [Clostridia bacterium]